jgi:hypothetical protein
VLATDRRFAPLCSNGPSGRSGHSRFVGQENRTKGKVEGKEGRREGKGGRIKVDVGSDGTTSVDVKCAEDEPMRACADLTKEIIDKVKGTPPR